MNRFLKWLLTLTIIFISFDYIRDLDFQNSKKAPHKRIKKSKRVYKLDQTTLKHWGDNQSFYKINSEAMYVHPKKDLINLDVVDGDINLKDDEDSFTFSADQGIVENNKTLLRLIGNIEFLGKKDVVFQTQELIYNQSKEKIYGEKDIKITLKEKQIEGKGFTYDLSQRELKVNYPKVMVE